MKRIFLFLVISLFLLAGCTDKSNNTDTKIVETLKNDKTSIPPNFYKIINNASDSFTLILYDKNQNIVHKEFYPKEPYINKIDENTIQIIISLGSPLNYTQFYNWDTQKISPTYANLLLTKHNKAIYISPPNVLVISDIFDKNTYYKEVKLKLSITAVPISAIIDISFIESNKIKIKYLSGEDFEEKIDIIKL